MRIIFVIFVLIGLLYLMAAAFRFCESLEEENRILASAAETARLYSRSLTERTEEIRRFRHDAAGILQAIEYTASGDADLPADPESPVPSLPALPLMQSILALKHRQCRQEKIPFSLRISISDPALLPAEEDLCLILQNLLENGREANEPLPERDRSLCLKMEQAGNGLLLMIQNSIPKGKSISFLSGKAEPGHGLGLRIVDSVLSRCRGKRTVKVDAANGILTTCVEIPGVHGSAFLHQNHIA